MTSSPLLVDFAAASASLPPFPGELSHFLSPTPRSTFQLPHNKPKRRSSKSSCACDLQPHRERQSHAVSAKAHTVHSTRWDLVTRWSLWLYTSSFVKVLQGGERCRELMLHPMVCWQTCPARLSRRSQTLLFHLHHRHLQTLLCTQRKVEAETRRCSRQSALLRQHCTRSNAHPQNKIKVTCGRWKSC